MMRVICFGDISTWKFRGKSQEVWMAVFVAHLSIWSIQSVFASLSFPMCFIPRRSERACYAWAYTILTCTLQLWVLRASPWPQEPSLAVADLWSTYWHESWLPLSPGAQVALYRRPRLTSVRSLHENGYFSIPVHVSRNFLLQSRSRISSLSSQHNDIIYETHFRHSRYYPEQLRVLW